MSYFGAAYFGRGYFGAGYWGDGLAPQPPAPPPIPPTPPPPPAPPPPKGTYTTNDLALRVLRDLNIIALDEIPQASDFNFAVETIRSEFARMEADGIRMWGTTVDIIDNVYFTELSRRMGFALATAYGIMPASQAEQGKEASEAIIRRLAAATKTPELLIIERAARGARIRDPIISQ